MKKQVSSFSLSPDNIAYIDDQWESKGKRNRSHWLDDLITHLRTKQEPVKRFTPPTYDEVHSYMLSRDKTISLTEAERFVDYWQSVNWTRNKTKMKDWKASVRTWLKNNTGKKSVTEVNRNNLEGDW